MNRRGLVALLFCACHTTSVPPPAAPPEATVTGQVAVDPAAGPATARGALFVSWLTEAEKPTFDRGTPPIRLVRDIITRGVVAGDIDPAQNAAFTLPAVHQLRGGLIAVGVGLRLAVRRFGPPDRPRAGALGR